ncbi:MAG: 4Fe-4S dicluster domain-containing protein [Candidatus Methanosuratincola subterraneus]|uniref:4Fe-4S dicluster domain-containing protein n=2 Tax=Candidatus Methanosuratincola (ex Vanwonterghem et al. 2016) TaxID=1915412 RepID=A0A3S3RCV4_METS7|nr:MAG: 4Fe-4S dicluster domain-containing protein [Candidatus Methanosuratincola subterraneus]
MMSYIVAPQKKLKEPIPVPGTKEKVTDLVIIHDQTKCTGCGQCMIGCAYKHFRTFDRRFGLLYVYEDPINKGRYVNANCSHCVFPMCLASCPKEAIYKDEKGIVRISPLLCVGCGTCNQACPIGIPRLDEERKVYVKCDFCDGEWPMCVQMCSSNALRLLPRKEAFEYVKKLRGGK